MAPDYGVANGIWLSNNPMETGTISSLH